MRHVTVLVVDASGRPRPNTRVSIYVIQSFASGMKGPQYTDSSGEAEFRLDIDETAQISVYVDGNEHVQAGSVKAAYKVIL